MNKAKTIVDKDRLQMYISVTKITIVLCWLSLFAFWAIKIFGGNWFKIMVENENFIKFSNAVQNTWLKYLVSLFTIGISFYLMYSAVIQRIKLKGFNLYFLLICILSNWAVINFVNIVFLKTAFGYTILIISGIIFQKGWKRCYGFIATALDFVFSTLSMLTRNIEVSLVYDYSISYILSIDVYLMYGLYCLYFNLIRMRKEC